MVSKHLRHFVNIAGRFIRYQSKLVYTEMGYYGSSHIELECGPMPSLMVALPNIGGALCSTPQSLADTHY